MDQRRSPFTYGREVSEALENALLMAVDAGDIDPQGHDAATVEAARACARALDERGTRAPTALYGTFLRYLDALGLTPRGEHGEG